MPLTACADIDGATGETYSPTPADVAHVIVVLVTATNPGGSSTEASAPTATPILANPPVNTLAPTIAGTPADGGTLTAGHGTWSGTPTITYEHQWQRCAGDGTACADIDGATDETYSPTGADAGHAIVVVVTATNAGGSVAEASSPTEPVTAEPPVNTVPPSVTGTPADGGTLTADPGTWTGTLPITYEYQWQRCTDDGTACADIPGATGATYTPTGADVGHPIVVVVTATNPGDSATHSLAADGRHAARAARQHDAAAGADRHGRRRRHADRRSRRLDRRRHHHLHLPVAALRGRRNGLRRHRRRDRRDLLARRRRRRPRDRRRGHRDQRRRRPPPRPPRRPPPRSPPPRRSTPRRPASPATRPTARC